MRTQANAVPGAGAPVRAARLRLTRRGPGSGHPGAGQGSGTGTGRPASDDVIQGEVIDPDRPQDTPPKP